MEESGLKEETKGEENLIINVKPII